VQAHAVVHPGAVVVKARHAGAARRAVLAAPRARAAARGAALWREEHPIRRVGWCVCVVCVCRQETLTFEVSPQSTQGTPPLGPNARHAPKRHASQPRQAQLTCEVCGSIVRRDAPRAGC
jgi:hypothetical protein